MYRLPIMEDCEPYVFLSLHVDNAFFVRLLIFLSVLCYSTQHVPAMNIDFG